MLSFQLINTRTGRASTVPTPIKGFQDWGGVLGEDLMAAALIDRIHHCHIVNIRGNSYHRMRDHRNLLRWGADRRRKWVAS